MIEPESTGAADSSSFWESLRQLRVERGFSVEGIAQALDVRPAYVEAIERGELGRCLGPGYARSMATRYAVCMGIDPEPVVAELNLPSRVSVGLSSDSGPTRKPVRNESPSLEPRIAPAVREGSQFTRWLLWASLGLGLLAVAFLGAVQLGAFQQQEGEASAQTEAGGAVVEVSGEEDSSATTTSAPAQGSGETSAGTAAAAAVAITTSTVRPSSYSITFRLTGESWLEVIDEESGESLASDVLGEDEDFELTVEGPLLIRVGKPENVFVEIDGRAVDSPRGLNWRATAQGLEAR